MCKHYGCWLTPTLRDLVEDTLYSIYTLVYMQSSYVDLVELVPHVNHLYKGMHIYSFVVGFNMYRITFMGSRNITSTVSSLI